MRLGTGLARLEDIFVELTKDTGFESSLIERGQEVTVFWLFSGASCAASG